MRIWDQYLSEEDKRVFPASGYGAFFGIGQRPALVVIDVTYGFTGDRDEPVLDSIAKWPNSCGPVSWKAMPHIAELLEAFRARNLPIFYTKMAPARPDGLGSCEWRSDRATMIPRGAPGYDANEIVRDIAPEPRDVVIEKYAPSAFFGTSLIAHLTALNADSIVVCGTTTSGCVRGTVVDAFSHHIRVAVAEDATFDRGEASHAISLFDMDAKYADVMPTADIVQHIAEVPDDLFAGRIAPAAAASLSR